MKEKIISNKQYFLYSDLSNELKAIYYKKIYRYLLNLVFEYQGFNTWYNNLFFTGYDLCNNREIVLCEIDYKIAAVAILKNSSMEKKVCTFRVAKEYQHQGIGHELMERSFELLKTDKPMITLHKNKLSQFSKLLDYYNFSLEQTKKHYYNIFSTELVYNGVLPEKQSIFGSFEIIDMQNVYNNYVVLDKRE